MPFNEMHERWLVEKGEHAVKVLEKIFEQRHSFTLVRQFGIFPMRKYVTEDLWLPIDPFVVI